MITELVSKGGGIGTETVCAEYHIPGTRYILDWWQHQFKVNNTRGIFFSHEKSAKYAASPSQAVPRHLKQYPGGKSSRTAQLGHFLRGAHFEEGGGERGGGGVLTPLRGIGTLGTTERKIIGPAVDWLSGRIDS